MTLRLLIKPENDTVADLYRHSLGTAHQGDAGFDLYFPQDLVLAPHKMTLVDLGVACAMYLSKSCNSIPLFPQPALSYYLYPRSSISKTPLRLANSVGIIDSGYRGNLKVALDNTSSDPYTIERGQRLFQLTGPSLQSFDEIELTSELTETSRGTGGHGSTGTK